MALQVGSRVLTTRRSNVLADDGHMPQVYAACESQKVHVYCVVFLCANAQCLTCHAHPHP